MNAYSWEWTYFLNASKHSVMHMKPPGAITPGDRIRVYDADDGWCDISRPIGTSFDPIWVDESYVFEVHILSEKASNELCIEFYNFTESRTYSDLRPTDAPNARMTLNHNSADIRELGIHVPREIAVFENACPCTKNGMIVNPFCPRTNACSAITAAIKLLESILVPERLSATEKAIPERCMSQLGGRRDSFEIIDVIQYIRHALQQKSQFDYTC